MFSLDLADGALVRKGPSGPRRAANTRAVAARRGRGPGDGAGRRDRQGRGVRRGDRPGEVGDRRDDRDSRRQPASRPSAAPRWPCRSSTTARTPTASRSTTDRAWWSEAARRDLDGYHVVKGAKRLEVRAADHQAFEAEVIAADPRSDLAVIVPRELPGVAAPKLRPLPIGDASKLRKGSFLVALGNPFNAAHGRPSASWGILANVARRLLPTSDESGNRSLQLRHYPTLLQLDAKLNLGMGGGAVVDLNGALVGVTTAAASVAGFNAQAGYAIPMDRWAAAPSSRWSRARRSNMASSASRSTSKGPTASRRPGPARPPPRGACRPTTSSSPSRACPSTMPRAWCLPSTSTPPAPRSS